MKKIRFDSFGIDIGDTSYGWKSLYWVIPQAIKGFFKRIYYKFIYPISDRIFWKKLYGKQRGEK